MVSIKYAATPADRLENLGPTDLLIPRFPATVSTSSASPASQASLRAFIRTGSWKETKELLDLLLPAVIALLGSAVGFYFGTKVK